MEPTPYLTELSCKHLPCIVRSRLAFVPLPILTSRQLSEALKRDVYCVDLRNHGEAPHIDRLDYPSLAADVERFCADHKLTHPILVGHSMGAKTVMAVGLRSPELASMIVSVDNSPVDLSRGTGSVFARYVRQLKIITERVRPMVKDIKEADAILAQVEPRKEVRQFVFTNLTRVRKPAVGEFPLQSKIPLKIIGDALDKGNISGWPFDSSYVRWSGDILFIRGSMSTYVTDDLFPEIGKFFPRFEVKDVAAGHWLISENPKEFIEVLVEYVERKEEERRDELEGNRDLF
ncbi:hypothetical protein BABINDRAFT_160229 [Babjeviella inositovora NRRL Y-12698]|uniref:AB hydrolase-1 domain-containing protein n=1 Tax=Babjeviella inositovora NRRL Y-12698 TaxID=984486 RepID=A0A1E3QWH9_9ASCO|nr:uncharacterized protein BABINDRAFT_160229 [Babjeviella inositovora NRRL Y-12698]ODQ82016.1 hypothetical protein BABINDRAFT_160229 [Babjeviella inositovora NRRL Y-12698]